MTKAFLIAACVTGATAVALGAFGAHGLKARLSPDQLQVFETAVRYQFYHTFALFVAAWLANKLPNAFPNYAGWCFLGGILLFSGSLYLLSTKSLLHIESWKWLGPVTPFGGLLFLAGWALLLWGIVKTKL